MNRNNSNSVPVSGVSWGLPVAMASTACFQIVFLIILRNGQLSFNSNYALVSWGFGFAIFVFPTLCCGIASCLFRLQTRIASIFNITLGLSYCVFVWITLVMILNASFRSYDFLLPLGMISFGAICVFLVFVGSVCLEKIILRSRKI